MNDFAVLSPYLIPDSMPGKRVNVGDGLILRAIERFLGRFSPSRTLTSRSRPDVGQIEILRGAHTVILAGANQLNDSYSVWPDATAEYLRQLALRLVPFGIGLDGDPRKNIALRPGTIEILREIHRSTEFSSWRCPRTVAVLVKAMPDIADRFLMTGCPVVYDRPLLDGVRFHDKEAVVAVTVTERGQFLERESTILRYVARRFKASRRLLVLHQDFRQQRRFEPALSHVPFSRLFVSRIVRLRLLARSLGFDIAVPRSADDCLSLYDGVDIHIGSRLHAHLLFLSRNKKTWLVPVDDRSLGFAEFLGFPLCAPDRIDEELTFDFERVRSNAQLHFGTMKLFLRSLGHPV